MNAACLAFRSGLEAKLSARPDRAAFSELAWHEHLLACGACRAMLEEEEALELVLATLPEPVLPARLVRRVLARLRSVRPDARAARGGARELDDLLEVDRDAHVPEGLAESVLASLRAARASHAPHATGAETASGSAAHSAGATHVASDLDSLLDRDQVHAPDDLARRVLQRLAPLRDRKGVRDVRRVRRVGSRALLALAASAAAAALWMGWNRSERPTLRGADETLVAVGDESGVANDAAPEPELLAAFDVLEEWDTLAHADLDEALSTFGPTDEVLLDFTANEPGDESSAIDADPSQG